MKRKIFSAVLALVMLLTLAPMAVAAEETDEPVVVLPDGTKVVGIPTIDAPEMALSAEETVIPIPDEDAFDAITQNQWVSGATFEILDDLDLGPLFTEHNIQNFYGLVNFFYGHITGVWMEEEQRYPIIKGIPSSKALFRYPIGGTIENLTFDHGTETPYITLLAGSFSDQRETEIFTLNNITVIGNDEVDTRVTTNYSPFVYSCPTSGIVMQDCVNEINMIGSGYSSVFFGYYPAYTDIDGVDKTEDMRIEFINCKNNGSLTTNRAGMFFGNSTGLDNYIGRIQLLIQGCENNGSILGFASANYLCAAAAQDGEYNPGNPSDIIEQILAGTASAEDEAKYPKIQKVGGTPNTLGKAPTIDGFEAQWNTDNTITFKPATNDNDVAYYKVRVGSYVHIWNPETNKFFGTYLYTVDQEFTSESVAGMESVKADLMAYGFADSGYAETSEYICGYPVCEGDNGEMYYVIKNDSESKTQYYATTELITPTQPADNGTIAPDVVIVTAYDADNVVLQTIWMMAPGGST